MDPVTLLGVVASSIQIAQFIGTTIQNLHTLKGKFQDADLTIRLVIYQLSTIKASITRIHEWAEFNFDDSPKDQKFLDGLNVALDGCNVATDALSAEVDDLVASTDATAGVVPPPLGIRARVKAVWSEDSMKAHQDRLNGQVHALQLLLTASQCWDVTSQARLLGWKENQRIIQKVVEDTKSLRESQSSAGSQGTGSARGSTTGGTTFDFDRRLQEAEPYQAAASRRPAASSRVVPTRPFSRRPTRTPQARNDEGYETGWRSSDPDILHSPSANAVRDMSTLHNGTGVPLGMDDLYIYRSNSAAATSTASEPDIHRWLSSSASDSPPPSDDVSDLRKRKFWPSRLNRLNTFSASRLPSPAQKAQSAGAAFGNGQRRRRNQETNITQSIDFTSADGLETPGLVRVAQAGNIVEIKRLMDDGGDIEARHIPTQRTPLAVAAHCGHTEVVRLLMRFNAKVDTRDYQLSTPLHLASSRGHCKAMESLLLSDDVALEAVDMNDQTPLWIAADRGHLRAVEMLLKRGAKVNARAKDQLTALHAAAKEGDKEMIELLLRHKSHIEARDNNSMTALHHACDNGHELAADFLLQKGANIEGKGKDMKSPLIFAASAGHYQLVQLLSKRKALPKSGDEENANALHWSARNGHLEVVEYLLEWKLPLTADINGYTPLHHAVMGSHFAVVDFLLRKGASVQSICKEGRTPLHHACRFDNADIVRLLLSAGATREAQVPGDGRRAVHIAAANGSVKILRVLQVKGVELSPRDSAGDRPLCIACRHGHVDIVEQLLDYGEPLRSRSKTRPNEDSPLCIASQAGHLEVVRFLIQRGASVKQRDEFGYIPLRYAAYYGHPEVLQLLLEEGAELLDDGGDSHGWGFVLMPDMIGFSEDTHISEERKNRVRKLLEEAESNIDRWNRDDDPNLAWTPQSDVDRRGVRQMLGYQGNGTGRSELHGSGYRSDSSSVHQSELGGGNRRSELPGHISISSYPNVPRTTLSPPRSPPQAHYRPYRQAHPHQDEERPRAPQTSTESPNPYSDVSPYSPANELSHRNPSVLTQRHTYSPYDRVSSIPEEDTMSEQTQFGQSFGFIAELDAGSDGDRRSSLQTALKGFGISRLSVPRADVGRSKP